MKILKSWLKDYIDINISDSELIDKLNITGTEVDDIKKLVDDNIVVAEILKVDTHPNADRLRLATVFDGKEEKFIVCGAPNIEAGQKVPLAKIGAKIGDFEIKEAEIRGVKSFGMLCSEKELGIGEDHSGIKILEASLKPGTPLNEVIPVDTTLELEITPNRGDCLSHLGIAREIAAFTCQSLKEQTIELENSSDSVLSINIINPEDCYSYYGAYIKGVKITESPDWLKKRLVACGAKPINNIVDITNYIMLDLGQPLHAFDATKVENKSITVRRAEESEDIVTLDGEIRNLSSNNLVIADDKKAIAVAGVMGGANSEISNITTEIILESAEFAPQVIRKSAKNLKLSTEASYRYERGVDPLGTEKAFKKAIELILEIAEGELVDLKANVAKEYKEKSLDLPYEKINSLLGLSLSEEDINNKLESLGFKITDNKAVVPSWRHDIDLWQDLAEEVGRLYEYSNIPLLEIPKEEAKLDSDYYKKEYIKDILVDSGLVEVLNYSFLSEEDTKTAKLKTDDLLEVSNPIQPENKYLRSSLIPGLLKTIAKNPTFDPILIFELGNVFTKNREKTSIALAASGKNSKKLLENAVTKLKGELGLPFEININDLSRDELIRYKIRKPITHFVELELKEILEKGNFENKDLSLKIQERKVHYRPISKFPSLTRDLAFILDLDTGADTVADTIYEISALINRVELFDEFSSDKFGQNKKNLAFHLYLQHGDRTLTDKEADEIIGKIISEVEGKFNAKLRDT